MFGILANSLMTATRNLPKRVPPKPREVTD